MSQKLHIVSLGCTKNLVDTEVMLGRLRTFTMCDAPEDADVIIVNTCGFIDAAKEESLQTVLNLHDLRKEDSLLVMAGCLSERYREELALELPEVDLFTGVGDYAKIDELLAKKESRFTDATFLIDGESRVITGSSTHAYIKLSEGCNQACSFCAIPHFKGKLYSRTKESVLKEIRALVAQGYYDISLISQDTSSYGRDLGLKEGLAELIEAIETIKGLQKARVLYLYPTTLSERLIKSIAQSTLFENYFDIPLQHIDDGVLKTMKRGMGEQATRDLINQLLALPNAFVRTSFIVGHPSESEAAFENLMDYVNTTPFDMVNVFAYSDEEGTRAYEMEDMKVDIDVIETRTEALSNLIERKLEANLKHYIGKEINLTINGVSDEIELLYSGKNLAWAPEIDPEILINDSEIETLDTTTIYHAKITGTTPTQLLATVLKP